MFKCPWNSFRIPKFSFILWNDTIFASLQIHPWRNFIYMTSFLRTTSFWFLAQKQHGTPVSAVTEHLENNVDQNKNAKSWQYVNSTPNFRILPTMQKLWQAFLRFWEYPRLALITTANAQISDVSNSHLIDCRSFCPIQKAILHAAVSNNRQTPWGGSQDYQFGIS